MSNKLFDLACAARNALNAVLAHARANAEDDDAASVFMCAKQALIELEKSYNAFAQKSDESR